MIRIKHCDFEERKQIIRSQQTSKLTMHKLLFPMLSLLLPIPATGVANKVDFLMKSFQPKNFQLTFSVVVSWKKRARSMMAHICRQSDGQALKDVLLPARRKMPAVFSTSAFSSSGATCTGKGRYATQQAQLLQDSVPKVLVPNYNWCISSRPNQRIASAYVHHLYNFK